MSICDLSLGKKLTTQYNAGFPYKHIVIDNFIDDKNLLSDIKKEFDEYNNWGADATSTSSSTSRLKWYSPWCKESMSTLPEKTKFLLDYLNGQEFINFLNDLTGIVNLEPDLTLAGGGMHRILSGGKLSVHEDFGIHPDFPWWYRRVNLLLYLNPEWNEDWGGTLQLYDFESKKMMREFQPIFNRAIIFNTSGGALHGHPHPLNTPDNITRDSLALYYYTGHPAPEGSSGTIGATWYSVDENGNLV